MTHAGAGPHCDRGSEGMWGRVSACVVQTASVPGCFAGGEIADCQESFGSATCNRSGLHLVHQTMIVEVCVLGEKSFRQCP